MQINNAKKYGEFVEITAPVERTASEEFPNVLCCMRDSAHGV